MDAVEREIRQITRFRDSVINIMADKYGLDKDIAIELQEDYLEPLMDDYVEETMHYGSEYWADKLHSTYISK